MPSRSLPGLGLEGGRAAGEGGWATEMNANLLLLSTLAQCGAKSRVTALPGSPVNGDIYIVPSSAGTNANRVAIRDAGAWTYFTPFEGFKAYVQDEDSYYVWNGSAWTVEVLGIHTPTASYTLALVDAHRYVRTEVASANNVTVPANATVAFAIGTQIQVVQGGAGQTSIVAAGGVTINTPETMMLRKRYSSVTLTKVDTNEWDLSGDLELLP